MPVLSLPLVAGRKYLPRAAAPRGDGRREYPSKDPSTGRPGRAPGAVPRRRGGEPPRATAGPGLPRPGRAPYPGPSPAQLGTQSQSFSRGYGSSLPTSLTYILLPARGCSPRRPDADMGTVWREGTLSEQRCPDFQVLRRGASDAARTAALFGAKTLSPSDSGVSRPSAP